MKLLRWTCDWKLQMNNNFELFVGNIRGKSWARPIRNIPWKPIQRGKRRQRGDWYQKVGWEELSDRWPEQTISRINVIDVRKNTFCYLLQQYLCSSSPVIDSKFFKNVNRFKVSPAFRSMRQLNPPKNRDVALIIEEEVKNAMEMQAKNRFIERRGSFQSPSTKDSYDLTAKRSSLPRFW